MIRHTGGLALGATSTRSSSCSRACASASGRGRTPSCSPSAPTRKTSRARMRSLILTSCAAMWSPASSGISSAIEELEVPGRDDGGHGKCPPSNDRPHRETKESYNMRTRRTRSVAVVLVAGWGSERGSHFPGCLCVIAGRVRISCQDTRVSSLWTPSGEHRPEEEPSAAPGAPPEPGGEEGLSQEDYEELLQARAELAAVPVADIIANHAIGLQQLAVIHLLPDPDPDGSPNEPRLAEAGLAIDALAALVDGLGDRLAPHNEALREAVTQLRLAFVELSSRQ